MPLTLQDIKSQIEYSLKIPDLAAKNKKGDLPIWRGMYCKIACENTGFTLRQIGAKVNLSHATVIYWKRNFENEFLTRKEVEHRYWFTLNQLGAAVAKNRALVQIEKVAEDIVNSMIR